ncbi:hypothetical protein ABID14_001403 [Peptoniphilus olsenii]|uniref:Transporter-associated domain-containing protein n=1 Tax=Peptoniphilus olsenii TaxID=411570 RepID=A0ABV2JDB6_9FIRM
MNRKKYLVGLLRIVNIFEIIVSIMLIAGVIFAVPDIVKYYFQIIQSDELASYELFQHFLSHVLLLVIAIEFVVLMIAHTDSNIIHLIMLVISRKMLVYSDTMLDLLVAVVAIAILFAVRKFLVTSVTEDGVLEHATEFSASTSIQKLNAKYDLDINGGKSTTLGGYVFSLLEEAREEPDIGVIVEDGTYLFQILRASGGVIETVSIERIENKKEEKSKE